MVIVSIFLSLSGKEYGPAIGAKYTTEDRENPAPQGPSHLSKVGEVHARSEEPRVSLYSGFYSLPMPEAYQ